MTTKNRLMKSFSLGLSSLVLGVAASMAVALNAQASHHDQGMGVKMAEKIQGSQEAQAKSVEIHSTSGVGQEKKTPQGAKKHKKTKKTAQAAEKNQEQGAHP